ncbi:MAG: carboxypeptidase-like regulatory domain-containing protein [Planctomycetota bacterium]
MPRGTIVVLLVLLAAGLAAWLVLGGSERMSGQRELIDSAVSADVGDAAPLLGSASLAGDGASTAEAASPQARLGPWVASLLVEGPDGTPVAGAQVTVRSTVDAFALTPQQGRDVARARTGADGRVHFGALPTPTVTVLVTAPGFAPRSLSLGLPQPGSEAPVHRVRLWPPGTVLHVVVHAQDGTPLPVLKSSRTARSATSTDRRRSSTDAAGRAELALGMWRISRWSYAPLAISSSARPPSLRLLATSNRWTSPFSAHAK